jgi:hypothetical protein
MERHLSAICSNYFRPIFFGQKMGLIHCDVVANGDGMKNGHISTNIGRFCPPECALESFGVDYFFLRSRNNKFLCYYIH